MNFKVDVLSLEQFDAAFAGVCTRAAVTSDHPDFYAEWSAVRSSLEAALIPFLSGVQHRMPDFEVSDEWSSLRQQAMGIYHLSMFCREFVLSVQRFLRAQPQYWFVHVACECYDFDAGLPWSEVVITPEAAITPSAAILGALDVPHLTRTTTRSA